MKLLEIIVWMGAAAQVYYCPAAAKQYVVKLDGIVVMCVFERPKADSVKLLIESKL